MKLNEASWDRVARVVLGIVLFVLGLTGVASGVWMWVVYVLGVVMFATAAIGFCPIYAMLGIGTKK
ncbi:MAG: DUF2892 domain-containing protein [Chloroflexi bacterium]|nr:DUF2892 domain-containing protein [Chloroflexota bacterium]